MCLKLTHLPKQDASIERLVLQVPAGPGMFVAKQDSDLFEDCTVSLYRKMAGQSVVLGLLQVLLHCQVLASSSPAVLRDGFLLRYTPGLLFDIFGMANSSQYEKLMGCIEPR